MNQQESQKVVTLYEGKWLVMKAVHFKIRDKECYWELIERAQNKPSFGGVDVIPIIKRKNKKDQILIIANYRVPISKFILEFCSGLMDDLSVEDNAIRELKEETGYTSSQIIHFESKSQATFTDPWKSNEQCHLVILNIDGDLPENQNPQQALENEEDIRVHFVDLDQNLCENLSKLAKTENYEIQSILWTFAIGYCFSKIVA